MRGENSFVVLPLTGIRYKISIYIFVDKDVDNYICVTMCVHVCQ